MDQMIEYKGWIVAGAFLLFFVWERLKPVVLGEERVGRRVLKNLSFWPLNIVLSLLIVLPVTLYATQISLWERPSLLILDIILLDLFIFWWHQAVHRVPFLWRFHEIHHLDEHLDATSAIRFHFGEVFFSTFVRAFVIIVFAIPFYSVLVFEILVMVCSVFHHSNIKLPSWFERLLSKIIVTPSLHWVHHHALRQDTDSNYGTIFSFWDRLFYTKSSTHRTVTLKIGVEKKNDTGFLKLLVKPFL